MTGWPLWALTWPHKYLHTLCPYRGLISIRVLQLLGVKPCLLFPRSSWTSGQTTSHYQPSLLPGQVENCTAQSSVPWEDTSSPLPFRTMPEGFCNTMIIHFQVCQHTIRTICKSDLNYFVSQLVIKSFAWSSSVDQNRSGNATGLDAFGDAKI